MSEKQQTGEHHATNVEVDTSNRKWGLAQIAAICLAFSTIGAFATGFWSSVVQAGGKDHFATVEQVATVTKAVEALDAGAAKKEDVQRLQDSVDKLDKKFDRMTEILLKQKGGK